MVSKSGKIQWVSGLGYTREYQQDIGSGEEACPPRREKWEAVARTTKNPIFTRQQHGSQVSNKTWDLRPPRQTSHQFANLLLCFEEDSFKLWIVCDEFHF
jgi:hypothetical protein